MAASQICQFHYEDITLKFINSGMFWLVFNDNDV